MLIHSDCFVRTKRLQTDLRFFRLFLDVRLFLNASLGMLQANNGDQALKMVGTTTNTVYDYLPNVLASMQL